ncbi:MAG: polyprenyl synthetase family protein [Crocinitomicaceae bacterium]|nr:polyprenyl synthetase family protein [Crocinitomicaceae bacterium]
MDAIKALTAEVSQEIQNMEVPKFPSNLYDPIKYFLSLGGKRIRPVLCLIGHQLFDDNYKDSIPQAIAIELFHNFSLIHDDIMDQAPLRRGKETVHQKWNQNIGILSGDSIMIKSYDYLIQAPAQFLPELLCVFNTTAKEICEGQQMDLDFETQEDITVADYIEMIRLKTAVLLGCSLKLGAIRGGGSKEDQNNLYKFGESLGISFQIQDDIMDVYADPDKFGKTVGGDIICNKKTLLMLRLQELATPEDKLLLESYFELTDADEKIDKVKALYEKYNIKEIATKEMMNYYNAGIEALNNVSIESEKKAPLKEIAEFLIQRES